MNLWKKRKNCLHKKGLWPFCFVQIASPRFIDFTVLADYNLTK